MLTIIPLQRRTSFVCTDDYSIHVIDSHASNGLNKFAICIGSTMCARNFFYSLLFFCGVIAFANPGERRNSFYTEQPPVIDGLLNDDVWNQAQQVTGFKTFVPDFSENMKFKTVAFWSHDEDNLYFAFKCYDEPGLIKTSVAARDKIQDDDWVCINLDSFNDRQTLYGFYINPNGIQMDSRFAGGRDDTGIDMIWYSAGQIDEEGYTVEIKIPFKSIRYAVKDGQVDMGVIFERKISRLSTQGTFPALDPGQGFNFLTQTMPLHFDRVKKTTLLELLPAVTYGNSKVRHEGETLKDDQADLSITAKYGLTSDLIFDATYNPDFSQVEADALQVEVNQRFPVFFPERRPFFQEGSEHFNHAGGSGRAEIRNIVNTRSIVNPITAGKLTGKIGNSNIVSVIGAVDELDTAYDANVGVVRYKRAFTRDSYLGGYWTGRNEDDFMNLVFGADGQYRINDATLVSGHFFNSVTRDHGEVDANRVHAAAANYAVRNRKVSYGAGYTNIGDGFESAVGFVTRTGIIKYNVFYSPKFYPKESLVKRIDPLIYVSYTLDKPSGLYENSYFSRVNITLPRNTTFNVGANSSNEIFDGQKFDRSSVSLSARSQLNRRVFVSGNYRWQRRIFYSDAEQGRGKSISGSLIFQFSDNLNSEWRYSYTDLFNKVTSEKYFDIHILSSRNTYQVNKYMFFRAIVQYNSLTQVLSPNFLASFTYIPGTVVHLGYSAVYDRQEWDPESRQYMDGNDFINRAQGLFFKASYLWRY